MMVLFTSTDQKWDNDAHKARTITALCLTSLALAKKPMEGVDPNSCSCDPDGQQFLLLPSYDDCKNFYMCVYGLEVQFTCPLGTIFDFELQGCGHEWATPCVLRTDSSEGGLPEEVEGSGAESSEGGLPEEVEGSGDSGGEWAPKRPGGGEETHGDDEDAGVELLAAKYFSQTMLNCRTTEDSIKQVAYRGDCQRYWRCLSGVPQAVYCSDGLFFNKRTQQCDFEANVRCLVVAEEELDGEFIAA